MSDMIALRAEARSLRRRIRRREPGVRALKERLRLVVHEILRRELGVSEPDA